MRRVSLSDPPLTYDPDDPEGYRAGLSKLGPALGAEQTGMSLYELPPGQALCPYHFEYAEEEWVLALTAGASVRTPEGTEALAPLDAVFFPRGPEGAHQIRNDSEAVVRVVMWSTVVHPAATAYPDSGKVGIYTDVPGEEPAIFRRADAVDYYAGEE